jgi:hypothetical protein
VNPVQVQELPRDQLMLLAQSKRPQHHAAEEVPPGIRSHLVGRQVQVIEKFSNHRKKGETEACFEHGLVTQTSWRSERTMAPDPLSANRILTNGGMKHSFLILRSSAFDNLLSHIAGWASPRPSESSPPPLGIVEKVKRLTKEKKSGSEEVQCRDARKEGRQQES